MARRFRRTAKHATTLSSFSSATARRNPSRNFSHKNHNAQIGTRSVLGIRVICGLRRRNMKRIFILLCVLLVAGLVRGDQDPLKVNPKTIALKLENARVRVLEATLKPGAKENTHHN